MISIYHTLCYPHLTYCVPIWASTWPTFTKKLSVAQNKIIRCIFFFMQKFELKKQVFIDNNILKFPYTHKYFTLLLIFKSQDKHSIYHLMHNNVKYKKQQTMLTLFVQYLELLHLKTALQVLAPTSLIVCLLIKKTSHNSQHFKIQERSNKKILLIQQKCE